MMRMSILLLTEGQIDVTLDMMHVSYGLKAAFEANRWEGFDDLSGDRPRIMQKIEKFLKIAIESSE